MAEITIKKESPCIDIYKIAEDMGVSASKVDDTLVEKWAREHKGGNGYTMLDRVCSVALYTAGHELARRVESDVPDSAGSLYEHEGVGFRVTVERDVCDVIVCVETMFKVGG